MENKESLTNAGHRRNWTTLSLITGVAVGFVLGLLGFIPIPEVVVDWRLPARAAGEYAPALSVNAGQEVAFVFVGSSNCGWSNVPELPNMVKGLKLELRKRAENLGMSFAAVGIARDIIATNGIRHLEKFGDFDEVMSGRGWANIGVLKYVYGDQLSGPAATPQVLVIERSLDDTAGHIALTAERVVARKTGLDEITQWVQSGARTPLLGLGRGLDLVPKQASRVRGASFGCSSCHRADLAASMGLFCRLARG